MSFSIKSCSILIACLMVVLSAGATHSLPVRGFSEMLVPTSEPTEAQKSSVLAVREVFLKRSHPADVSAWTAWLAAEPQSPYRMAVLVNLGEIHFHNSRFTSCIAAYKEAWNLGKELRQHPAEPLAGRAAGELALMLARLGRYEPLEALLKSVEGREFRGPGSNLLAGAQSGFQLMTESPETSFRCGPMALSRILAAKGEREVFPDPIRQSVSTRQGMSLTQVHEIAEKVGLGALRAIKRTAGSAVPVPSVVHWKLGHYAAIVREVNGEYDIEDPTFGVGVKLRASKATLDTESSGYFMAEAATLPAGWTEVEDAEAATIFGKGQTSAGDPGATGPGDHKSGGSGGNSPSGGDPCGMAQWSVHSMLVSLNIMDRPMAYTPPVGPAVSMLLTYNSKENETISTPPHTHFGPKWIFNQIAYLQESASEAVVTGGYGGSVKYAVDTANAGQFLREKQTYSRLVRLNNNPAFERQWPDGTREIFDVVGPTGLVYRSEIIDPQGNSLSFQYGPLTNDARLVKIIDEIGQETVLEYAGAGLQPVKITDPFGRFSTFQYDGNGRLTHITDVVGITSQFTYRDTGNFIRTLTTPYGSTHFTTGFTGTTNWLQATYPNGDLERFEFRHNAEGVPSTLSPVPTGLLVYGINNNYRNALHWDRKAMKEAPGDVSKARLTHFLHTPGGTCSGLIESEKLPLEGRVFYNYEGQVHPAVASDSNRRTKVGRVLDDGSTQLYETEYNAAGKPTKITDPLGRITLFTYDTNLQDVIEMRQQVGAGTELLGAWTYNAQHLPLTFTDAAGSVTTFTYNARGQLLTITKPGAQVTTMTYNTNGYLTQVDGPLAGSTDVSTLGYDSKGRLNSITDPSGLTLALEYDHLNRLTRRTYPDGQYEQWTYENLSPKTFRSRGGAVTTYTHNSLGQLVEILDALNRRTVLDWCKCGDLKTLIDPLGNMTRFFHDVQGRLTGKAYADGTSTQILYEPLSGRVSKTIDEMGREQLFSYAKDNRVTDISYGGTAPATPAVTLAWDAVYGRLTQMTDGSGTTNFGYRPVAVGQQGAGYVSSIDGPLSNDTITFTHDTHGRVTGLGVDSVMQNSTLDALGRAASITNALGTFGHTFEGASNRLQFLTRPGGGNTTMIYHTSPANLKMLANIQNRNPGGTLVSRFDYGYNAERLPNSIIRRVDGGSPLTDTPGYDTVQRLISYAKGLTGGGTQTFTYTYDAASNRITANDGTTTIGTTANALNQASNVTPAPATARDYEWDGAGRLSAIVEGVNRSEFSYDGFGRRVRIVEKVSGSTVADRRFVWIGLVPVEERDASNVVVKRFFAQGFTAGGTAFFYLRDHLGSIREVVDASGAVRARYDYDPYGRRTKLSGDVDADFGFAGMFEHAPSKLCLTYARAYDPLLGRWISRDPSGEASGYNLYAYVLNNPMRHVDLLGLDISAYPVDQLAWGGQYPDMMINVGKTLLNSAAFGGAAFGVALTAAAAPVLAPAALAAGVAVTGGAVLWTGYGLAQSSRNLVLNANGFANEFDGNPIKDGISTDCWDPDDPMTPLKNAGVTAAAVAGDLATGRALSAWLGSVAMAVPAVADMGANILSVMDLAPALNAVSGGVAPYMPAPVISPAGPDHSKF